MAGPKLEIIDLSMKYHTLNGETDAIKDFSLTVDEGEFIAIVGPSGCGKSTLLSLVSGLLKPSSGKIFLEGKEVVGTSSSIGYMFQKDDLFEWRTILQNVMLGLEIQNRDTPGEHRRLEEMLEKYGLGNFKSYYPRQLSGGMRQRVALIRTLALNPELLLLDEPFSALDYQTRLAVSDEVGAILKDEQKTTILVTHDIAEAISMASRIVVLSARPAEIRNIYDINLTCEIKTPIKCREAPEFRYYFNKIWKELDIHVK
jgi:NitT/TauT family transport system ATP-binding protein